MAMCPAVEPPRLTRLAEDVVHAHRGVLSTFVLFSCSFCVFFFFPLSCLLSLVLHVSLSFSFLLPSGWKPTKVVDQDPYRP